MNKILISFFLFFIFSNSAQAYLGPGTGIGVILGSLGILVALLVSIFGIIWFPIRRLLNRNKSKDKNKNVNKN